MGWFEDVTKIITGVGEALKTEEEKIDKAKAAGVEKNPFDGPGSPRSLVNSFDDAMVEMFGEEYVKDLKSRIERRRVEKENDDREEIVVDEDDG